MTLEEIKERFKFIDNARELAIGDRLSTSYNLQKIKRLIWKEVAKDTEPKKRFKYPCEKGKYIIVRVK